QHVRRLTEGYALDDWRLAQKSRVFWLNLRRQYKYLGTFVEPYVTWKLRLDPVYRGLDALVPEHGHILDIGCGVGIAANLLANRSITRTVHGIDSDEAKIHVAKVSARGRPSVTLETADALSADLPRADAVLLIDVLHYWTPENQRRLIERACAALAPGGVLVFRDALAEDNRAYRATAWGEAFTTTFGINRRREGLHFQSRAFYETAFADQGMAIELERPDMARGANAVFVLRKESV
ncbi:MAG: class I SAM-dependent methyltransferase, partial [bacterium]|nr:class I SAM-dependent methyltransferase [bacterium]